LPVVASHVGGIPYVVTDGVDGLLVPYGDVAGFAHAMQQLLCDSDRYNAMAMQARNNAARFDWSRIAERIIHHFR